MYRELQQRLIKAVREVLRTSYGIEDAAIIVEQPPQVRFGEYAMPLAFELAKRLRKAPRKIAEEVVAALGTIQGFAKFEVAGAGYINAHLERAQLARSLVRSAQPVSATGEKVIVEHTSINPNKAAH